MKRTGLIQSICEWPSFIVKRNRKKLMGSVNGEKTINNGLIRENSSIINVLLNLHINIKNTHTN